MADRQADVIIGAALDPSFDTTLGKADDQLGKLGDAVNKMPPPSIRPYRQTLDGINQNIDATRRQRAELRGGMMDAVALGASIYGLIKPAVEFESAMANVNKIIGDIDVTKQIGEDLRAMTREIPLAHGELADIAAAGARMGIDPSDIIGYTDMVAKMAVAWEMSADAAGMAIGKIGNILELNMDEQRLLGDAINKLDDTSSAQAPEIIEMLKRIAGEAKNVGIAGKDAAALATTMLDLGVRAETGSTAIIDLFNTLSNAPNLKGKYAAQAFKDLGLDTAELQRVMFDDGLAGIEMFREALSKLSEADAKRVMTDIFGTGYTTANIQKLITAQGKLQENLDAVGKRGDFAGSVLKEFESRSNTTANKLILMKNAAYDASVQLGGSLLGAVTAVSGVFTTALIGVTEFGAAFPMLSTAIVGAVAGFAALKISTLALGYGWTFVREGALQAQKAVTLTYATMTGQNWAAIGARIAPIGTAIRGIGTAFRAASIAMMTTPIGLVIGGIALAVGGAALVIRKYWEPITTFFGGVWEGMQGIFTEMGAVVSEAFEPLKAAAAPLEPIFTGIGNAVGTVVGWFQDLLTPVTQTEDQMNATKEAGVAFGEVVKTVLVGALDTLLVPVRALVWGFTNLSSALSNIFEWFGSLGPRLSEFGTELATVFDEEGWVEAGKTLAYGLWKGIASVFTGIYEWMSERIAALVDIMPSWVTDALGIEREAKVLSDDEISHLLKERGEEVRASEPGFNRRQAELRAQREAVETYADDTTNFLGFSAASDAVEAQRAQMVAQKVEQEYHDWRRQQNERVHAEVMRYEEELRAKNEEIREERRDKVRDAIGDSILDPTTPVTVEADEAVVQPMGAEPLGEWPGGPVPKPRPEVFTPTPMPEGGAAIQAQQPIVIPAPAPNRDVAGEADAAIASIYKQGAEIVNQAMAQAVALESARAAALAAERPRSITAHVQAPITVNNYGPADAGGQAVRRGVSEGANDILAAERDQYVD